MPMSLSLQASWNRCKALDDGLSDFDFEKTPNHMVRVIDHEGAVYNLPNANYLADPEDEQWIWVVTEHQAFFVFAKDEISFIAEYTKVKGYDCVRVPNDTADALRAWAMRDEDESAAPGPSEEDAPLRRRIRPARPAKSPLPPLAPDQPMDNLRSGQKPGIGSCFVDPAEVAELLAEESEKTKP